MDILKILKEHNIDYADQGSNVKEGNVNVKCPFCADDPSKHMGIDVTTGIYGCWRNDTHRGRRVERLVAKLLGVSVIKARSILGIGSFTDTSNFGSEAMRMLTQKDVEVSTERKLGGVKRLKFRPELRPLWLHDSSFNREPFLKYLFERGFDDPEALAKRYELMFATYSDWRYRIVAPIFYNNRLATWIGRAISPASTLKYKDLSIDASVRHAKFCLFDYPHISEGGRRLFVVEGYFDAMKLGWYLPDERDKVTCLFTKTMTPEQAEILIKLSPKYEQIIILLDEDAIVQSMGIKSRLSLFAKNVTIMMVPGAFKDPGEMTKESIVEWGQVDVQKTENNSVIVCRRILARPGGDEKVPEMRHRRVVP